MKKVLQKVVVGVLVLAALLVGGCGVKASHYTEEQHIERVTKRVEKRYMGKDSAYTGFEVFPLYDENEELKFFLVEFEPQGFVYVKLNEYSYRMCYVPGMYLREVYEGDSWRRYTVEVGIRPTPTITYPSGLEVEFPDRRWETDENGNFIDYRDSHFKVAGIENEKRYLLEIETLESLGGHGYVPAVKRDDKYLNLISMTEMELSSEILINHAISETCFYPDASLNL